MGSAERLIDDDTTAPTRPRPLLRPEGHDLDCGGRSDRGRGVRRPPRATDRRGGRHRQLLGRVDDRRHLRPRGHHAEHECARRIVADDGRTIGPAHHPDHDLAAGPGAPEQPPAPVGLVGRVVSAGPGSRGFRALGTTGVVLVDDPRTAGLALAAAQREVEAVDRACSRFRSDSELSRLLQNPGIPTAVSPLLAAALSTSFAAAEATNGLVDPTIAAALRTWGYDMDFAAMPADLPPLTMTVAAVPGWRTVR